MSQMGLFSSDSSESENSARKEFVDKNSTSGEDQSAKWMDLLQPEFEKQYFRELKDFVKGERAAGKTIYPPDSDVFNSLSMCPFHKVKVVIALCFILSESTNLIHPS